MSDLMRHSRHEYLDEVKQVVAIGGGHGLGRIMSALSFMKLPPIMVALQGEFV